MKTKRILYIGAHPDDADIQCGGTAVKMSRAGHQVMFVSVTNGDTGHHLMSRTETARRRWKEAQNSTRFSGVVEYKVLDHPCGIEPTVKMRREILRIIRRFSPDVVISHRLCDYHPDHRATAQLVLDTAYVVMVPHFCEDAPIPERSPVYAHSYDRFQEPRPFRADAMVEIDSVLKDKLAILDCHASQAYEWMPWGDGIRDFDVNKLTPEEREEHLKRWIARFKTAAEEGRNRLKEIYGPENGDHIEYAEVFEQSPYGRTVPQEEFQQLFTP